MSSNDSIAKDSFVDDEEYKKKGLVDKEQYEGGDDEKDEDED